MLDQNWKELTFVSFDTETTGRYPLTADICELAAVKWRGGTVIDTFTTLLKPSKPMTIDNIQIHGISNQMVENAPHVKEKIGEFHNFIQDAVLIAHHAPFDLGFVAVEFEKMNLKLPDHPVICSSLLARQTITGTADHRLQTLVQHFRLDGGQAHRALDDAKSCLHVSLKCMEQMEDFINGVNSNGQISFNIEAAFAETQPARKSLRLHDVLTKQGGALNWLRFSMDALKSHPIGQSLIEATVTQSVFEVTYSGGSIPNQTRILKSDGIVRSLDGDFIAAYELDSKGKPLERRPKRFYIDKITSVNLRTTSL